jgi:hypothetical protein
LVVGPWSLANPDALAFFWKADFAQPLEKNLADFADDRRLTTLLGLYDFAAAQAGRAHADTLGAALHFGVNGTQIDVPAPLSHIVGVADVVSKLRPFAADRANLCHDYSG